MDPYNYGLMDPNIHGTPMFMLHLPSEALNKIVSLSKSDAQLTRAQYTQDGLDIQQLIDNGHKNIDYQTIDVGYACKRCNLVCKFKFNSYKRNLFKFIKISLKPFKFSSDLIKIIF
jgi:hypothetical protein